MLLVGQVRRYIEFYNVRAGGSCLWNCIVRTALPAVYVLLCSLTLSIIHLLLLLFKHFGRSPSMHSCIDHDFPCSGKHPQFSPQFSVIIFPTLSFSLPPLRRLQVWCHVLPNTKISQYPKTLPSLLASESWFVLRAVAPRSCANQAAGLAPLPIIRCSYESISTVYIRISQMVIHTPLFSPRI